MSHVLLLERYAMSCHSCYLPQRYATFVSVGAREGVVCMCRELSFAHIVVFVFSFHIRFVDIARGGIRIVRSRNQAQLLENAQGCPLDITPAYIAV